MKNPMKRYQTGQINFSLLFAYRYISPYSTIVFVQWISQTLHLLLLFFFLQCLSEFSLSKYFG